MWVSCVTPNTRCFWVPHRSVETWQPFIDFPLLFFFHILNAQGKIPKFRFRFVLDMWQVVFRNYPARVGKSLGNSLVISVFPSRKRPFVSLPPWFFLAESPLAVRKVLWNCMAMIIWIHHVVQLGSSSDKCGVVVGCFDWCLSFESFTICQYVMWWVSFQCWFC